MRDSVRAPDMRLRPKIELKQSIPNSPNTILGIPDSVSVNRRMTLTAKLPFFAYSAR